MRWVLAVVVGTGAAAALLAVLSGLPAVGARMPALRALRVEAQQTVQRAVGWGRELVAHPRPAPAADRLPAPEAAAPASDGSSSDGSSLTVLSRPSGAAVYLDDRPAGTTPLVVNGLAPGTYRITVLRAGYAPAVRTVKVGLDDATVEIALASAPSARKSARSAPRPAAAPTAASPRLAAGSPAPPFALKDRLGIIYRLEHYRGRRTAILFVWDLGADAQRAIRDLDDRVRRAPPLSALVVVMRADRVAVRGFLATWPVQVPLVFGTSEVARQYRLTPGVPALYVISEEGAVERAYTGTVRPQAVR